MSELRILTVRQPWAWAIIHGGKDVENRTRSLGPYRGPVAIHAGKTWDEAAPLWLVERYLYASRIEQGAIIGVVDLVDAHWSGMECSRGVPCHEYGLCSPWAEAYQHHLVLANPRPLTEPIQYKGALGLRRLPDDVAARVWAGVAS